ncbi:hypothetical protein HAX54_040986, partial [Datura stramonium]|nr:hypothetical protein [Datura stramonium]
DCFASAMNPLRRYITHCSESAAVKLAKPNTHWGSCPSGQLKSTPHTSLSPTLNNLA